jgi:hypothetical protein
VQVLRAHRGTARPDQEHDTESLGTDNLDHVVGKALQLIFKRDTQFESWLEQ